MKLSLPDIFKMFWMRSFNTHILNSRKYFALLILVNGLLYLSDCLKRKDHPSPVRAEISIRQVDFGSTFKFILVVNLVNTGFVQLAEGWSVIVNITQDDKCSGQSSVGALNTVIIQECHPSLCSLSGFQQIHHSLPSDIESKLPLSVTVSLSYEMPQAFAAKEEIGGETSGTSLYHEDSMVKPTCITVAFHLENLNISHFVKPAAPNTSSVTGGREDAVTDVANGGIEAVLINLAMKRPTGWKVKEKLEGFGGESKNQYSTSIRFVEKVAEQLINQSEFKLDSFLWQK